MQAEYSKGQLSESSAANDNIVAALGEVYACEPLLSQLFR